MREITVKERREVKKPFIKTAHSYDVVDVGNVLDEMDTALVKEQLKKVVEWLENLPTDGHDKWYYYHKELARRILKEIG